MCHSNMVGSAMPIDFCTFYEACEGFYKSINLESFMRKKKRKEGSAKYRSPLTVDI